MSETISFSPGNVLTVGLSRGERELFSGRDLRSVLDISSCCVRLVPASDFERCFSGYLPLIASMGFTLVTILLNRCGRFDTPWFPGTDHSHPVLLLHVKISSCRASSCY